MAKETKKKAKSTAKNATKKTTVKKAPAKKTTTKTTPKKNIKEVKTKVEKKEVKKPARTQGQEVMKRIETSRGKEFKKMGIILVTVIVVLGLFYFVAGVVTGNIDLNKNEPAEIQYSEILAGSTFKQNSTEYIVIYYDYTSEKASDYGNLISTYLQKENALGVYAVDLSRKFNASYIYKDGDTPNTNPTSASELKVKEGTLIQIKDKKVTKYLENYEDIENYMSE